MTDYSELKAKAEAAGKEWWQQGRFLDLPQYARQSPEWKEAAQQRELRTVFVHFSTLDQGTGRVRIADCPHIEHAAFIAAANPAVILAILAELDALRAKSERATGFLESFIYEAHKGYVGDMPTDDAEAFVKGMESKP